MTLQEKVYWHETVVMPAAEPLNPLPPKVDVAVIGGGIPGLAAALQLARRGVAVGVLEAETIGWGASSRNGGMALTGLKLDAEVVETRYGHDLTRVLFEDSLASLSRLSRSSTRSKSNASSPAQVTYCWQINPPITLPCSTKPNGTPSISTTTHACSPRMSCILSLAHRPTLAAWWTRPVQV